MQMLTAEIEKQEEALRQAMLHDDLTALDALLHPDLVYTGPDGSQIGKAEDLAAHRKQLIKITRLDFSGRQIQAWGDAAGVVVTADMEALFQGKPLPGRFRFTRLWKRDAGRWQVIMGHCSQL